MIKLVDPIIFYYPTMKKLAMSISAQTGIPVGEIDWDYFDKGEGWFKGKIIDNVTGRDVIFLASFDSDKVYFQQLGVMAAFPKYLASSLQVILPYFPVGTMERVEEGDGNIIVTAMTMARHLSVTPMSSGGPAVITMFDFHFSGLRFYFSDNVLPNHQTAVPLFKNVFEHIQKKEGKKIAIAFPDEGARKRYGKLFTDYHIITCEKRRKSDGTKEVRIIDGDPRGKHVIIFDDLVKTGGTLIECGKEIKKMGAVNVSCAVVHADFVGGSHKRFTNGLFKYFFVTNTQPVKVKALSGLEPFRVLSIASLLSRELKKNMFSEILKRELEKMGITPQSSKELEKILTKK